MRSRCGPVLPWACSGRRSNVSRVTTTPGQWPAPPAQWPAPPWSGPQPSRTNGFAIASLVCACAQVVVWPLAFALAVAAIVTGHVARHQIRQTGEGGSGIALAGLIAGYVGLVLYILLAIGIVLFLLLGTPVIAQHVVRDNARHFTTNLVNDAASRSTSPRDVQLIRSRYLVEVSSSNGCCDANEIHLADGTSVLRATGMDFVRNQWQLEFSKSIVYERHACVTIPSATTSPIVVRDGRCG